MVEKPLLVREPCKPHTTESYTTTHLDNSPIPGIPTLLCGLGNISCPLCRRSGYCRAHADGTHASSQQ